MIVRGLLEIPGDSRVDSATIRDALKGNVPFDYCSGIEVESLDGGGFLISLHGQSHLTIRVVFDRVNAGLARLFRGVRFSFQIREITAKLEVK